MAILSKTPTQYLTQCLTALTDTIVISNIATSNIATSKSVLTPLLLVSLFTTLPISAQSALPEAIQIALNQATIKPENISMLVTPVGNNTASHLPPVVQVIEKPVESTSSMIVSEKTSSSEKINPLVITLTKENIEQRERQLAAYTDEPYIYQSLENLPPVLIIDENRVITKADKQNLDASTANSATTLPALISHYPTTLRTPASTMKLIPSWVALDILGADFVWFTRVYYAGVLVGNRLHGDLIIQGSGDPKITHERLNQLLYQVQKAGIRHIDGNIIIDSSIFKNVNKDPAAFDNAPLRPYNASPDGFLVNFNSLAIKSQLLTNSSSNSPQAKLTYEPLLAGFQLPDLIDTRLASCSQASSSLAPQWEKDKLTLNAKLPLSCGDHLFYINYPDTKDFAARIIASKWQTLGNTLTGEVLTQESAYPLNSITAINKSKYVSYNFNSMISPMPLVSYPSLSLAEQIYDINHFSNNVMTEQVALSIGSYQPFNKIENDKAVNKTKLISLYQFGKPQSTDYPQALQSINQWWQNNLTSPPPYLTNGSGLCRDCTLTAANLDELLGYAYNHPSFDTYVHSLGIAGVDGTIVHHSDRLPNSAAIGRAWIKTGTLNNVSAMAGYVKARSGQDYTVVGLINTQQALNADSARLVLDTMLDWTAQQ